jgi:Ser/Thr protein kinase RdoA (MazF antagonist)
MPLIETVEASLHHWPVGNVLRLTEIHHDGLAGRAFRAETSEERFVAKVAYDRPQFVVPGLAISERVASRGIPTGPPLRTATGELAVSLRCGESEWTLALLVEEPGAPIDLAEASAPGRLGRLLAQLHLVLASLTQPSDVPARLLDWWGQFARQQGDTTTLHVLERLEQLGVDQLPHSVLYGDPSPEVLDDYGRLAIIDWGTPSWGPQILELACWSRFVGHSGEARLLAAYDEFRGLSPLERELLALWRPLLDGVVGPR